MASKIEMRPIRRVRSLPPLKFTEIWNPPNQVPKEEWNKEPIYINVDRREIRSWGTYKGHELLNPYYDPEYKKENK